jgi:hypothetical protein
MPTQAELTAAGRSDLLRAIAKAGKPPLLPCSIYCKETVCYLLLQHLHQLQHACLLSVQSALACPAGGAHAAADKLGWRTQRRPRGELLDAAAAAEAFAEYLRSLPKGPAQRRMPSQKALVADGRRDLRYALQASLHAVTLTVFILLRCNAPGCWAAACKACLPFLVMCALSTVQGLCVMLFLLLYVPSEHFRNRI